MVSGMQRSSTAIIGGVCLAVGVAGCSPVSEPAPQGPLQEVHSPELPAPPPPPAPGPNFHGYRRAIAVPGTADVGELDEAQIDAMFDEAVARARPGETKRAICVGLQGIADRAVKDAPERSIRRLAVLLRLPAFPASQCSADITPRVTANNAEAILYTVKVESRDRKGILTFWATAVFGNVGAYGMEFRLVREGERWKSEPTGRSLVS